jgi:hypothetical protein
MMLWREAEPIVSETASTPANWPVETLLAILTPITPVFLPPDPCSARIQHQSTA